MPTRSPTPLVLLLPGLYDSGPTHWQSRWERTLPEHGLPVERVRQADWVTPRCEDWVRTLSLAVAGCPGDVLLAGHSTACALVAHWAGSAEVALVSRVRGALLVGPSDPTGPAYPPGPSGFAPVPLDRLPFPSVVVASRNDEYVALEQARQYAEHWGSRFVDAGEAGHLNGDAGYGAWPEGIAMLQELAGTRC